MARIARRQSGTDIYHGILRGDTTLLWQFGGGYVELNANGTPTGWNYYVTDHLGSTRMVVDSNDSIRETVNYYPFGSEMKMENPALLVDDYWQRFRFTGKELDKQNGLNMYDFGARWYDVAGVPMWTSVDPLAEKYYNVSPYAYCANNPVNAIDPDGRKVKILYWNNKGKHVSFSFSGSQSDYKNIPNNSFVRDFIQAYEYNKKNGGGDNLIKAVTNPNYEIKVINALDRRYKGSVETIYFYQYGEQYVKWESRRGIRTSEGGHQSPATRLEHEFDHAVDYLENGSAHRSRKETDDKDYTNKEERRVITGSEAKTAKANGESIRKDHFGVVYDTKSSISVEPND